MIYHYYLILLLYNLKKYNQVEYKIITFPSIIFENSVSLVFIAETSVLYNIVGPVNRKKVNVMEASNDLCEQFTPNSTCKTRNQFPYVCNACDEKKDCKSPKYYYKSHFAHPEYKDNVSKWKEGPKQTEAELKELDEIIKDGVSRSISIEVIIAMNKLNISTSTVYRLIDQGFLSVKNIDLKRKVRYKPIKTIKK